jgi:hypothetical protein
MRLFFSSPTPTKNEVRVSSHDGGPSMWVPNSCDLFRIADSNSFQPERWQSINIGRRTLHKATSQVIKTSSRAWRPFTKDTKTFMCNRPLQTTLWGKLYCKRFLWMSKRSTCSHDFVATGASPITSTGYHHGCDASPKSVQDEPDSTHLQSEPIYSPSQYLQPHWRHQSCTPVDPHMCALV